MRSEWEIKSFWPHSPSFLSHSIQIRSSLSELDWNELGWDWMRSEWFNQVLMDGHFRIKVKPLDFFSRSSRPIRGLDFELSTNRKPRFREFSAAGSILKRSHPSSFRSFDHHSVIWKPSLVSGLLYQNWIGMSWDGLKWGRNDLIRCCLL